LAYGLPATSYIGYPLPIPCAGHAGLGLRQAGPGDSTALVAHLAAMEASDRRLRFCATLGEDAVERHIAGLWTRRGVVLAAHDGPLWPGLLHHAGPVRAVAELAFGDKDVEVGLSVDGSMRRQGIGTYLLQAAAHLLAPRGIRRIVAYTLPENASFLALARGCGAEIELDADEVEVRFEVAALQRDYVRRRAREAFRRAA